MKPLYIDDPVYGAVTFSEALLLEAYQSQAVQRLKHIYQGGITAFIKPERQTTRLQHSVGVAALLRRMGADVIEQTAGLIHDVPHTAMSHVIDFVFPNREHTYHEEHREEMLVHSDLPAIFERHNLDWRVVAEAENFSLLEQPLPRLCADRLDYFFRDGVVDWQLFSAADVQTFLAHLRIWEGEMVVADITAARWFGNMFIRLDDLCWCNVQEVGWYAAAGRALHTALLDGTITTTDFRGTDVPLLAKVRTSNNPEVRRWLALLRADVDFVRDDEHSDLIALPKVRAVDPPVLLNGHVAPLSTLDTNFAQRRAAYIASKQGEWGLRIVA